MKDHTKNGKIVYLEILRTVALFFVLYAHSGEGGLLIYNGTDSPVLRFAGILFAGLCEFSVPVFFMISGALLLRKEESLGKIWKHRILPMSIITVLMVVFQYVYFCLRDGIAFDARQSLVFAYGGGSVTQQWFLYAYLSFLILLPFLQKLASKLEEKHFYYLFGMTAFVSTVVPLLTSLFDMPSAGITAPFATNILFYPLMGYYFANLFPEAEGKNKARYIAIECTALAVLIINALMNLHSYKADGSLAYADWFLYIYAIGMFVFIRHIGSAKKTAPFWIFCGSGVFGTYLFEIQLRDLIRMIPLNLPGGFAQYAYTLTSLILVMALGFGLMAVLKLIPVFKKYL